MESPSHLTLRRKLVPQIPGERCIQMLTFPNRILKIIEGLADSDSPNAEFETMGAMYDHAIQWFVSHQAAEPYTEYLGAVVTKKNVTTKRTFWINHSIFKKASAIADRDGVRTNRVLYTGVIRYLRYKNALL